MKITNYISENKRIILIFGLIASIIGIFYYINHNAEIILLGIVMGVFVICLSIRYPRIIVFLAIIFSGLVGTLANKNLSGLPLSLSGIITLFILITATVTLLFRKINRLLIISIKSYFSFILFIIYYFLRSITGPNVLDGFRITFLFAAPIIIGILAEYEILKREKTRNEIERYIMLVPLIPITIIVINLFLGTLEISSRGFHTTSIISLSPRVLSIFLLPILSLYMAKWRYNSKFLTKLFAGLSGTSITMVIIATLSRTVSIISLGFIWPMRFFKKIFSPKTFIVLLLGIGIIAAWFTLPGVYNRFFPQGFTGPESALNFLNNFDTQGRKNLWRLTWNSAIIKPIFGQGGGFSTVLIRNVYPNLEHPHNDFLRVFNDTGIIGLILFSFAWFSRLISHWKRWRYNDNSNLKTLGYHFAALITIGSLILSMLTDNTMTYVFVTFNTFCIFSLADTIKS